MAVKPENTFIAGVHKLLPATVYHMKTNNPYVAGIPDCYYSGNGGDLWVEYKHVVKLPTKVPVPIDLSKLQQHWLTNRHTEGRNVAVIVGHGMDGIILRAPEFNLEITAYDFRERMVSRRYIAEWIARQTTKR